jgi:glycolate oxidase iron-sulfur subunit
MRLGLDEDLLLACVSCGLCLPHCPTYRATGEELASPRGRISIMRAIEQGDVEVDETVQGALDSCVMCRGCETACPSGVSFGRLMEDTRASLPASSAAVPRWMGPALKALKFQRAVLFGSSLLGVAQRARIIPQKVTRRFGLPDQIPIRRPRLRGVVSAGSADAWLFTGCVMDAWQRNVHADALALMRQSGARVAVASPSGCCGALHAHAGRHDDAKEFAIAVMRNFPGDAPIVVDSAGCGAALQDYGHLVGTPEAQAFSARVVDVCTYLANRIDALGPATTGEREQIVLQDPCHLRHVQRAHLPVRTFLGKYVSVVELDDDGRCCGAGGSYSLVQPELATTIRTTKLEAIDRAVASQLLPGSGRPVVSSGNPGCSLWLEAAGLHVEHPVSIVARIGRKQGWLIGAG